MSILDQVQFTAVPAPAEHDGKLPFVTHEGTLEIFGRELRCYRISDGRAIINADDLRKFLGTIGIYPDSEKYVEATTTMMPNA